MATAQVVATRRGRDLASNPEFVLEHVAANIRRLRRRRGQTQEALADQLKVDVRYLQRLEAGKINVGIVTLARLAVCFGVSPARLLRRAALPRPTRGRPKAKK